MSEHELWNELGNLYFMSGAYDQAVRAYCRSIQLDTEFGRPYSNLALTYVQQGKYDQAIDLYRRSIELLADDKERAISWNRLGNVYRHLKDYQQAVVAFQRADELDPNSEEGREEPGQVIYPASQQEPTSEEARVAEISAGAEDHKPIAAPNVVEQTMPPEPESTTSSWTPPDSTQYEQGISDIPESPPLSTWTDEAMPEELEPFPELEEEAEAFVIDSDPEEFNQWIPLQVEPVDEMNLGSADIQDEKASPAEIIQPAYFPESEPSKFASLLSGKEDSARQTAYADAAYQQVELDVEDLPAAPTFVVAEEQERSTGTSEGRLEPQETMAEDQALRTSEAELKDIELDIAKFKRIVQVNPRNAIAWDTLGTLYKSAGLYRDAILAYQQAISIDSNKPYYHHHLGLVYAAEGRDEDAINAFQKVIELDPDYSLAHATLGGYYRKMGLDELAQKHIGKAMRVIYDSENEYNRACLEAICGNVDQAIELLRIALKNKQTYVDWVLRDPDLDFIRNDPRFKQLIADYAR